MEPLDMPDQYGPALDAALRTLGYSESELESADVADGDVPAFLALLDYYLLKLFLPRLAPAVDIAEGQGAIDKKRSQMVREARNLMLDAKAEARSYGYLAGDVQLGSITTNWIEPSASEF